MTSHVLHYGLADNIATLTLNNASTRNALSRDFWQDIKSIVAEIEDDDTVRVIVLRAEGPHFSSGIDRKMLSSLFQKRPELERGRRRNIFREMVLDLQESISILEKSTVPVIAAIQGACIGGAFDLVSAVDCRFATQDAYFNLKETELGFVADLGILQRLPHLIPPGLARELAYSSRSFGADEALRHGFVNNVFATKHEMDTAVYKVAQTIAERSPLAIYGTKEAFKYGSDHSVDDALKHMALWQSGMALTDDVGVAVKAMANKELPKFPDMPKNAPLYPKPTS